MLFIVSQEANRIDFLVWVNEFSSRSGSDAAAYGGIDKDYVGDRMCLIRW